MHLSLCAPVLLSNICYYLMRCAIIPINTKMLILLRYTDF